MEDITPDITIVDYGLANIRSVVNAFEYLGASVTIASCGEDLENAKSIVLPGVGAFDAGMKGLRERGYIEVLNDLVINKGVPYLGICLGMQFLMQGSAEGEQAGLGWFEGTCQRFPNGADHPSVPHVGWNTIKIHKTGVFFQDIETNPYFYFVHSYYIPYEHLPDLDMLATCHYGLTYAAAFQRHNIFACQFHPEKSQMTGLKLISNFLSQITAKEIATSCHLCNEGLRA